MTEAAKRAATPAEIVFAYHDRSKHQLARYAAGPETLDWTQQPNPFREFAGSPRLVLPFDAHGTAATFADIHAPGRVPPRPISIESVSALLELSMGLSAWKEYGPDRWALRCNPSSGNLHPTEAYVVCEQVPHITDGVYHYVSRDHLLEQRCAHAHTASQGTRLWIGLTSIHWREAWKYGERAFRYCQLDIGHAIAALSYAAATLGWHLQLVQSCDDARLSTLLGLDRHGDFNNAERESPDVLLAVAVDSSRAQRVSTPNASPDAAKVRWHGQANVLDREPMYRWPIIDDVAAATQFRSSREPEAPHSLQPRQYVPAPGGPTAREVILGRRSAQHFARNATMSRDAFFRLIDCVLARDCAPWNAWLYSPHIHLLLFVHRVEGLAPGLYALPRRADMLISLQHALRKDFLWRRPEGAPPALPIYQLLPGDCRQAARTLSCHQAIAADSCFSLAMLAEFSEVVTANPWRYRQLYWEAGLIGQVLYLEAEAAAFRGTGIGCYFDDALHELLGIDDHRFQSLYHFTVGRPLVDERISTLPPYAHRNSSNPAGTDHVDGGAG